MIYFSVFCDIEISLNLQMYFAQINKSTEKSWKNHENLDETSFSWYMFVCCKHCNQSKSLDTLKKYTLVSAFYKVSIGSNFTWVDFITDYIIILSENGSYSYYWAKCFSYIDRITKTNHSCQSKDNHNIHTQFRFTKNILSARSVVS